MTELKTEIIITVGMITYEFNAIIVAYVEIEDGDNEVPPSAEALFLGSEIVGDVYAYDDATGNDEYLVTSDSELAMLYNSVDWEDEMNRAIIG